MQTTWILAADSSRARIFEVAEKDRRLLEIQDFVNPEARMSERELQSDLQGRVYGYGEHYRAHSATEMVGVEHANELFGKELGRFLDKARTDHRYDRLYLIAPPKFLGLLRHKLSKEVQKLVAEEIDKDLSWLSEHDINRHLKAAGALQPKNPARPI
jgi:protein required for attachment to host cells